MILFVVLFRAYPEVEISINCFLVTILFFTSGCLSSDTNDLEENGNGEIILTIWYTFEGKEEDVFLNQLSSSKNLRKILRSRQFLNPMVPRTSFTPLLGDEAPDIMRFSSDQLGYVGKFRQNGFPLRGFTSVPNTY